MLLAVQLATLALGAAACPSSLANDLAAPAPAASHQLITVQAATTRSTHATVRTWSRRDGCWLSVGRPYTARVGKNGVRRTKLEGDGSGIFLHVQIGKATSGCISLRRSALIRVLRWLEPNALPQIAIGTTGSLRQARRS
jgi:L,D-peptidoglycan transpeptidase YkuD (ErfK/YbiS/YcfS/YnhG family)